MPDDLTNRGPADRSKVNIHEPWEVKYWCKKFGCTESQLKLAVMTVGTSADKVEAQLKRR